MSAVDDREGSQGLSSLVAGLPSQSWAGRGEKSATDTKRKIIPKNIKDF